MTSTIRPSRKSASFTESRLANLHGAVNLGQGFPDFPAPEELKAAAARAVAEDHNQYRITWGVPAFRDAIALKYLHDYGCRWTLRPRSVSPVARPRR